MKTKHLKLAFFSLAVFFNSVMDLIDFHIPRDSGWFSLDSGYDYALFGIWFLEVDFDAWHVMKMLAILFVVLGIIWKDNIKYVDIIKGVLLYAVINFLWHSISYHLIFKPLFGV